MDFLDTLIRPVHAIGRAVHNKKVEEFKDELGLHRGYSARNEISGKSYYVDKSLKDLYNMRNIKDLDKFLNIPDSAHFENVKRWLGLCCEARTWGNLSNDSVKGKEVDYGKADDWIDTNLADNSQEERLIRDNLPDYVVDAYKKLFDEYYEKMKNADKSALKLEFRAEVFKLAVKNMTGFDSISPEDDRRRTFTDTAGCGLSGELHSTLEDDISTESLEKPFELKEAADEKIRDAEGKNASKDTLGFLKGAVVNPWKAQIGAKYAIKEFLQETDGTDSNFEKKSKNAIFAMPNVLAPLLFTKEKAKARGEIIKNRWKVHVDNQKERLYIAKSWAKKSSDALYQATESLLEPKLRPLLAEYINLGIKENFYGNGHTGWLSSIYKSRKNLAEKIYFLRARPIAKSIGVDATRCALHWSKNAARWLERENKARHRKARSKVLGKLDIKQRMIKKCAKKYNYNSETGKYDLNKEDPYGLNRIDDLEYLGFWGGLWAVHQEKAFAKTNLYYNQLLNLIVACKKYKRARGHLACTPALLRRLYWVEAVEARAFQALPHMRYSAWTEKVLGSDYKYKTECNLSPVDAGMLYSYDARNLSPCCARNLSPSYDGNLDQSDDGNLDQSYDD